MPCALTKPIRPGVWAAAQRLAITMMEMLWQAGAAGGWLEEMAPKQVLLQAGIGDAQVILFPPSCSTYLVGSWLSQLDAGGMPRAGGAPD
jgi:hypothetical protein